MRRAVFALSLSLILAAPSALRGQDGVIELTALPNYGRNAGISNTGATLGRVLFYDKRLSRNNTVSCSSCHQQAHGFGSPDVAGTGVGGMTARHPMRLINAGSAQAPFPGAGAFFWDRRAQTLEELVTQPIRSAIEMGFSGTNGDPDFAQLISKLSALPEYQLLFTVAFGSPGIDEARIKNALTQFVRSIVSLDSKFDAANTLFTVPFPNYTESENRGKQLFITPPGPPVNGAGCAFCHHVSSFKTDSVGNNGVITAIGGGTDLTVSNAPTLRDLFNPSGQLNGPMMHNGAFTSISQVLDHYSAIPFNPKLDVLLANGAQGQTLNLSAQDRADIEAFLLTLSGKAVYTDAKLSNPFRPDGTITVTDAAPPASQAINLSTRMQVQTGDRVGIGGFIVTGSGSKRVLIRALGPSLGKVGVSNVLADPTITITGPGFAPVTNDNWRSAQQAEIEATGLAPGNDLESAFIGTFGPGGVTAVVKSATGGSGVAILEIYDLDPAANTKLANISTRAYAGHGEDALIAGFTIGRNSGADTVIVRGIGRLPLRVGQFMYDPTLEVRNADGSLLIASNDRVPGDDEPYRQGLVPESSGDPVVTLTLGPGAYTAILTPELVPCTNPFCGDQKYYYNPPNIALIEVYSLGRLP